jgi:type I restriction enzyme R subunit
VHLTDAKFARLRDEIATADVFTAAKTLHERNYFQREDGITIFTWTWDCRFCRECFQLIALGFSD